MFRPPRAQKKTGCQPYEHAPKRLTRAAADNCTDAVAPFVIVVPLQRARYIDHCGHASTMRASSLKEMEHTLVTAENTRVWDPHILEKQFGGIICLHSNLLQIIPSLETW